MTGSLHFDARPGGGWDYLQIPSSSDFQQSSEFTHEYWVNLESITGQITPIGRNANWITVQFINGYPVVVSYAQATIIDTRPGELDGTPLNINQWYHIAITMDSTRMITLYVDGEMISRELFAATQSIASGDLFIGQSGYPGSADSFPGYLYDVRFSNHLVYRGSFLKPSARCCTCSGISYSNDITESVNAIYGNIAANNNHGDGHQADGSPAFDDIFTNRNGNWPTTWYAKYSSTFITTGWIGQDFGSPKQIRMYRIYVLDPFMVGSGAGNIHCPKDWTFEGSHDGSNWEILHEITGGEFISEFLEFPICNSTSYQYYRVNVTANNGGANLIISQIEMMENTSPTTNLSTNVAAGSSSLEVGNQDIFNIGDTIGISGGGNSETATVSSFGSINLSQPLQYSYTAGALIEIISSVTPTPTPTVTPTPTPTPTPTSTPSSGYPSQITVTRNDTYIGVDGEGIYTLQPLQYLPNAGQDQEFYENANGWKIVIDSLGGGMCELWDDTDYTWDYTYDLDVFTGWSYITVT